MTATLKGTIAGLRRVLGAPGLWLGLVLGLGFAAHWVGLQVRIVVAAAVGSFDVLDLDRVLFGTIDVLRDHPAVGAAVETTLLASAVLSAVLWTLLSPLVVGRLAGRRSAAALAATEWEHLGPVLVQSLWHIIARALLVGAVVLSTQAVSPVALWILTGITWLLCGTALDATRVAVVEHGAARWHIKTALDGFVWIVRRPSVFVPAVILGLLQWGVTVVVLWLALRGYGEASVWPARVGAAMGIGMGLWRIAVVVEGAANDAATQTPT